MKKIIIKLFSLLLLYSFTQIGASGAYFTSTATIEGNTFTAGYWENEEEETSSGSVIINEVMWMGSTVSSSDEWIELRNTTGSPIDLTGWTIEGAGSGSTSVTLSGIIPANGYFLVSHYNSDNSAINDGISVDQVIAGISLVNSGEQLKLKNPVGVIIDQTPAGSWPAGYFDGSASGLHQSMERNDDPTTGWHTCTDDACNDTAYWDIEGSNYGTPKAPNLSKNDPSVNNSLEEQEPQIQGEKEAEKHEEEDFPPEKIEEEIQEAKEEATEEAEEVKEAVEEQGEIEEEQSFQEQQENTEEAIIAKELEVEEDTSDQDEHSEEPDAQAGNDDRKENPALQESENEELPSE